MDKQTRIVEQLTWLGWHLGADALPRLQVVDVLFANKYEQRTTRRDVLDERAFRKLRGYNFCRLQVMGYLRIDGAEFDELRSFLAMVRNLNIMPAESKLQQSVIVPGGHALDGKPLGIAAEVVTLQDQSIVTVHPRVYDKRTVNFYALQADLFTQSGVEEFISQLERTWS